MTLETKTVSLSSRIGWFVVGIIFFASTLRAPLTAVGPLVGFIRDDLHISNTFVGMLTTFPLLAFACFSPLVPGLSRRFGTEYTLMLSLVGMSLSIILRSLPLAGALFLGTVLLGISITFGNVLIPSLIKRDFPQKVGLFTGIYTIFMNGWAAIASGISIPLAQSFGLGWRGSLLSWTILCLVALAIWFPQLRLRKGSEHSSSTQKSKVHFWHSRLAWQVSLYMGLQSLFFYTAVAWLPEILNQQQGINYASAGWMLSLMQLVSLPTNFFTPILAVKCKNQRGLVIVGSAVLLIGYLGLISGNARLATLWVLLIGSAGGINFSLALMFFTLRTQDERDAAELSGMAQTIGYCIGAIGPSLLGFMHDMSQGWTFPLVTLAILALVLFIVGYGAGTKGYVSTHHSLD